MPLTQVSSRLIEDTLRYVLGASGTDHYTFTGKGLTGTVNDPGLTLSRGHTYIFENRNSNGAHPFYIKTSIVNGGTNDQYNTGVTNNGGAGGTEIVFTVPHDAPDLLYYQCSSHINMAGQLKIAGAITDGSITTAKLANDAVGADQLASNSVVSNSIVDGSIVDADVNASAAIAGTKVSPNFGSQNITTSGIIHSTGNQIKVEGATPKFTLTDADNNPDYEIQNNGGTLNINDITTGTTRFTVNSDGHVDVAGNLDVGAGLDVTGNITCTGTVSDSKGDLRKIPADSKSNAYTLQATDAGKLIYISTGGITVPVSAFVVGQAVSIINNSGSDQTITQGSGMTLYNTGDATTGNRTLAGRGMATIWFADYNIGYISGSGLS